MPSKLFDFVNADFFKPLTSMYKDRFLDCILRIYEICKNEFSYSAPRNEIVEDLSAYFEPDESDFVLDGEREVARGSREKANAILSNSRTMAGLKKKSVQITKCLSSLRNTRFPLSKAS